MLDDRFKYLDRRQKTENRRQKTENRIRKTEDGRFKTLYLMLISLVISYFTIRICAFEIINSSATQSSVEAG